MTSLTENQKIQFQEYENIKTNENSRYEKEW